MESHKIWIEQCEATVGIEREFGTQEALRYLIGEKFLNFLEASDDAPRFRAEIPGFVDEVKRIFEPWQVAEYLMIVRQSEPFDPDDYEDPDDVEVERQDELRRSAADLLFVERAREWLLED